MRYLALCGRWGRSGPGTRQGKKGAGGPAVPSEQVPRRLLLEDAKGGECQCPERSCARTGPASRSALPLLPGAGRPPGAGHAETAEDGDGADAVPVHVRVPRARSVPEELAAHISSRRSRQDRRWDTVTADKSACLTCTSSRPPVAHG